MRSIWERAPYPGSAGILPAMSAVRRERRPHMSALHSCSVLNILGLFMPAACAPSMHGLAFRWRVVCRTWQAPHYFSLVLCELGPGSQCFLATFRTASFTVHFQLLFVGCNSLECADLSALYSVATGRGHGLLNPPQQAASSRLRPKRRLVAALQNSSVYGSVLIV